ncbi:hydroxyethylthiazole kinase [Candidatus Woesearchaeota archaeon]|nr:hydroxyethylthiazole kinase [Candidatus Woesearchaeota archaeon]
MNEVYELLQKIKEKKPLIHHITNWVTIYDCANVTRQFGALPVMAHAKEEVSDMVKISSCLVLNIGTLTPDLVDAMVVAGKKANKLNIPVVLDIVGAGATPLRTKETKRLLDELRVEIIKGNAAEIATIAGVKAEIKGVEAVNVEGKPIDIAKKLAEETNSVVVITGKQDIIASSDSTYLVNNGHEMMGSIVGTGCMAASVIGCFAAAEKDKAKAAACALSCLGIAGELAAKKAKGPGTFKELFFDEICCLDEKKVKKGARIEIQRNLNKIR